MIMRSVLCTSLAVSLFAAACSTSESVAETAGSCEAPSIEIPTSEVQAEGSVEISGTSYFDGCADAVVVDTDGTQHKDEVRPLSNIPVALEQNGETIELGTVSASDDGSWTAQFPLPSNVAAGPAQIAAGTSEPVVLTVGPAK